MGYCPIASFGLTFLAVVAARTLLRIFVTRRSRHAAVKHIPGPPPSSWIYGNMRELMLPHEQGQHEFEWQTKYGLVYRVKGCFGEDRLMISDPHAIRHILADISTFRRSPQQEQLLRMLIGEWTILYVTGDDHQRIRGVMTPAFSAANVRTLPPFIRRTAVKIKNQWTQTLSRAESPLIDIFPFLHHATIDVIGEVILGVPFNTLETDASELARTHQNVVAMSSVSSSASVLLDGIVPYVPEAVLRLALYAPTTAMRHLRRNRELTAKMATELIEAKQDAFQNGLKTEKDLMSLLVNANARTTAPKKMSMIEMRGQVGGIMVAGQEATATTISWTLYELAKDPAAQEILRAEISEAYAATLSRGGGSELSYADLESMPYLNSFIREVLRLYAPFPITEREAVEDVILPLSRPIITTTGQRIRELPVKKGQFLNVAISAYHRETSIWGQDAKEFRASRWMRGENMKGGALGPYANLLSFLGGPRTCIGWRFAITEIQVFVIELIRNFAFSVPDGIKVRRRMAVTLIPVTGEGGGKQGVPLLVKALE